MSLRNRLTLLFTAIVSVLLALFCLLLYVVARQYVSNEFQTRLQSEALTAGHLLVGREPVGPTLFKLIDKNQLTVLPQEEIIIYDAKNKLVYESGTDYLTVTPGILKRVRQVRTLHWRDNERDVVGIFFTENQTPSVIFASAVDTFGGRTIQNLAYILAIGWFLMTALMVVAGRFYAGRTLQPINQINRRMDEITASNLSLRLPEGASGDELTQLAQRFNRMLTRLEEAFSLQRSFVSHASHELRTPLTAITGQLEVSLLAEDEPDELRATLHSVLDDVRGLNRMVNGLLSLAKANMDESSVPMGRVQLDTLLDQVQLDFQRLQPNYIIHVQIIPPDAPDHLWQLTGNEPLLRTAFFNLIDNGGKFSPAHTVSVTLSSNSKSVQLSVHNAGSTIPADQLTAIFIPFQRGRNASGQPGYGIGLPLAERIIRLHQGSIQVDSSATSGTTFTVTLPR
ncbi:HAMP domain-containing histidine kinase [Spirosoma sp. KCTC 42546]|uniref:HAMP domain-containing sensor histidine kinase n=1 Tax=Spirosoma sp. KCTC 42546 TaxID=2520506 RepID=UPI0011578B15|nr:HAMP domain-containing sensor histidine kinase [Spirosoma sp. KCTC 42546]QDK80593.1 HAMP domain-containing histidine kinase [Spirosoma sp. KCTC 42546]